MIVGAKLGAALSVPQLHVTADPGKCVSYGACERACPMSLPVSDLMASGSVGHGECI